MKLKDRAVELGYAAGWSVIKLLPRSVTWAVFRAGADRAARRRGPGAQRLERNLRQVVGPDVGQAELDLLVRDGLRSYARYWLEAFRLPKLSRTQIIDSFHFERGLLLGEAVAAGTGCVVALPHAGNWDLAGAWVGAHGWPLTTVAERLRPERLYQRFVAFRESLGMEIIAASGGTRAPIDVLVDRVREGRVVPLLADRDLSARGVEVRFFGGRTRMPPGPALLALRTGAPLYVCSLWYEGEVAHARLDGPVPPPTEGSLDVQIRALTQQVADYLARGIAEHPADWHMLQKLWLDPVGAPPASPHADPPAPPVSPAADPPAPPVSPAADPPAPPVSPAADPPAPPVSPAADPPAPPVSPAADPPAPPVSPAADPPAPPASPAADPPVLAADDGALSSPQRPG